MIKSVSVKDMEELNPSLPLLPRLDCLERLMQSVVERHCSSATPSSSLVRKVEHGDQCRSISSALEEVGRKGSVVERLTILEKRLLQLCLELDERSSSRSTTSSSNSVYENTENGLDPSAKPGRDLDARTIFQRKESGLEEKPRRGRRWKRDVALIRSKRWFGCT